MLKHKVTKLAEGTYCLSEFGLVNTFLIEGEEKAVLIDTGCGIGDLRSSVREITDKPLTVVLTHAHFDHDGGTALFRDCPIYLNPLDGEQLRFKTEEIIRLFGSAVPAEARQNYIRSRAAVRCPELKVEELLAVASKEDNDYDYLPIGDGDEIDLGGRVLKVIHTPGHTVGELCILDDRSRIMFSGDTANKSIILMRQPGDGNELIEICNSTMKKLWSRETEFDSLGPGHDASLMSKQIIRDYLELTEGILSGEIRGAYEELGFRKGEVARLGMAELWYRCDA